MALYRRKVAGPAPNCPHSRTQVDKEDSIKVWLLTWELKKERWANNLQALIAFGYAEGEGA